MSIETRTEKDPLGPLQVPNDALYGVQTVRALQNFPISGLKPLWPFVRSQVWIKKAAALTHKETGRLDARLADAIVQAADEVLARQARRALRRRSVSGRRRHVAQHERERGAREPRERDPGRHTRRVQAGASERSREHGAVHERHDPDEHPARRARASCRRSCSAFEAAARRARREGARVRRHREGGAHAPAGRDADPPRPGVHGVRGLDRSRAASRRARRRTTCAISASAAARSAPA